jgi:hypothetical protein
MAFGQLSDVGLRRLITEAEERSKSRSSAFLKQVLGNAQVYVCALGHHSNSAGGGGGAGDLDFVDGVSESALCIEWTSRRFDSGRRLSSTGPLFISTRDPEGTLFVPAPVIRPLLPLMAFAADPFHRLFDRSRRKGAGTREWRDDEEQDTEDDIQALIDVGKLREYWRRKRASSFTRYSSLAILVSVK